MSAPLTFVPTSDPSSAGPSVSLSTTSNAFGLHDTIRHGGHRSLHSEVQVDQYEQRLKNWDQTQAALKLQMARNAYGLGAPLRSLMEQKLVGADAALPQFSHSQFQLDILSGKDTTLDVEHFFNSRESYNPEGDNFHSQMEKRARM